MSKTNLKDALALGLQHKLGRRVTIGRFRQFGFKRGYSGKLVQDPTTGAYRYTLGIEGCQPSHFGPMNVNELKSRIAMLSDMLCSGVILKGEKNGDDASTTPPIGTGDLDQSAGASDSY